MTRDDVLKEFDPIDQLSWHWDALDIAEAMADEIVRLRGERDALKQRLVETEADWAQCIRASDDLEEEAKEYKSKWVELACVISNLREPSEAMVKAVDAALVHAPTRADVFRELIRRAVEAAEQEVNP